MSEQETMTCELVAWKSQFWCGCGWPEEAIEVLRDYLDVHRRRDDLYFLDLEASHAFCEKHGKGVFVLIGYLMHGAGIATHFGSVVSSSYLTPLGEELMVAVESGEFWSDDE